MKIKGEDRYNKLQKRKNQMPKHGMSNFLLEHLTDNAPKEHKKSNKKKGR